MTARLSSFCRPFRTLPFIAAPLMVVQYVMAQVLV
jgi:hypothetical protein